MRGLREGTLELADSKYLLFSGDLTECDVYIVTVQTSIDDHKRPNLTLLIRVPEAIGKVPELF